MTEAAQESTDLIDGDELVEPSAEEKLTAFFDAIGADDGTRISVHEVDEEHRQRRRFLFYVDVDQISSDELLAQILDEFGGGEYEVAAKNAAGQYKWRQRVFLGSGKKKPFRIPGPAKPDPAPAPATAGVDPNVLALIEGQNRILETLADRIGGAEPEKPKTLLEQITEFGQLKELFAPAAPAKTALDLVREFNELREEFSGETDDPLAMAIKQLLPTITKAVDKMDDAQRARPTRARHTPAPGAGTPSGTAPNGEAMNGIPAASAEVAILSMYMGPICQWAAGGVKPADAATQIGGMINDLPDEQFMAVLTYLEADDVIEKLTAIDPRVSNHAEWFKETIAAVSALFPPEPTDADGEPIAPGAPVVDIETPVTVDSPAGSPRTE